MNKSLQEQFNEHLQEERFFRKNEHVLIACSGGPDSTALFHLMFEYAKKFPSKLTLVHFNHDLRGAASQKDEAFVRALAKKHRVGCRVGKGDIKAHMKENRFSVEESARMLRYDYFHKISKQLKATKMVFGHTLDDQAETLLMRVFQGTGLSGLLGIRKTMKWKTLKVIRPLLEFTKQDILKYLKENKLKSCKDKTNQSMRFLRNRIRKQVIPQLEAEVNPKVRQAVSRMADIMATDNDFIEKAEKEAWKSVLKSAAKSKVVLDRRVFLELHESLQFRVANKAMRKRNPSSGLSYEHWRALKKSFDRKACRSTLPKNIDFQLTEKDVIFA